MSSSIGAAGAASDNSYGGGAHAAPEGAAGEASAASIEPIESHDSADLRLLIEDDEAAGSYIYKTIDRRTGEVVHQYPREEVLRLKEASDYAAGAVIKANA